MFRVKDSDHGAAGNAGGAEVEEYAAYEDELLREHAGCALARPAERGV